MFARQSSCLAVLLALVTGCAVSRFQPGNEPVVGYRPGRGAGGTEAPHTGEYVQCRGGDDVVVEQRSLPWGSPIGFKKYEDGRLIAWAGEEAIPIDEGEYRWHLLPLTPRQRIRNYFAGKDVVVTTHPVAALLYGTLFRVTVLPIYSLCVNGSLTPA